MEPTVEAAQGPRWWDRWVVGSVLEASWLSAPAVRGVGPGAQQQGDVELVGLVGDGENDL